MSIAKSTRIMPLATMEAIMSEVGATRVSEDAKKTLKKILEEYAGHIAHHAVLLAQHAGRKTVRVEDIKLAMKNTNSK
ncbi:MAG: histone family protein [Candidatus Woesearchaeota archaeon]